MGSGHVGSGVGRGIRGTNHAHGLPHSWTIGTKSKCKEAHFRMETSYCCAFILHSSLRSSSLIFYLSRSINPGKGMIKEEDSPDQ